MLTIGTIAKRLLRLACGLFLMVVVAAMFGAFHPHKPEYQVADLQQTALATPSPPEDDYGAAQPPAPVPTTPAPDPPARRVTLVGRNGSGVLVFTNEAALKKAAAFAEAGAAKPEFILPLVSCFVISGTPVAVTEGGFFSSTVTVVDGPQSGCEGVVDNSSLKF